MSQRGYLPSFSHESDASRPSHTIHFACIDEEFCLFEDIESQHNRDNSQKSNLPSSTSTSSINIVTPSATSGPVKNEITDIHTDDDGVVWITFPYSENSKVKNYKIRCDVHTVPPNALKPEVKTVKNAEYPKVGAIILGKRNFGEHSGRRFSYEWDRCWLGWSLIQLNSELEGRKGLLQRAADNVTSFVFKDCFSRTNGKKVFNSHRKKGNGTQVRDYQWQEHMQSCPKWLPALPQKKGGEKRLKDLYNDAMGKYQHYLESHRQTDLQVLVNASHEAVQFYFKGSIAPHLSSEMGDISFVDILLYPQLESNESEQITVYIPQSIPETRNLDSVRYAGAIFIDVIETTGITDELKAEITRKKSNLARYRKDHIGIVEASSNNFPDFLSLIRRCGLNVEEYEIYKKSFKLEVNSLGFKIVYAF